MGWDQDTTLEHLIRKAGYKGQIDYSRMRIQATRHQSSSTHVSHAQWVRFCKARTQQAAEASTAQ
jgi:AMMECR1 domain-containing protein